MSLERKRSGTMIETTITPALLAAVRNGERILCLSHVKPDGDAVGSLLGMGWLLRSLGKAPVLALQDTVPDEGRGLPGVEEILTDASPDFERIVRQQAFDLIVCLDASSPDRMGTVYHPPVHESATLVVIDHHVTNTGFGALNWVDPSSVSTTQMVARLADALEVPLTGPLAECLLTGLVTDTLCFSTSNVTPRTLELAMRLMEGGANLALITQRTVNRRPYRLIKLWSLILPTVNLADGVIWASATPEMLAQTGMPTSEVGLSSYLVTADEADMSAVFIEQVNGDGSTRVECSFRAKPGFNVAEVAFALGGGGHPAAAGCTVEGDLATIPPRVVAALQAARRRQLAARHGTA